MPDEAVQVHVDCVVTVMLPVAPPAAALMVNGETANVHDAPASVTTKLFPAIVRVALRDCVLVLAAAVNPTLPEPLPLAPLVIVTQDAPLVAVQLHPLLVVTVTVLLPPVAVKERLVGEIVYAQGVPA